MALLGRSRRASTHAGLGYGFQKQDVDLGLTTQTSGRIQKEDPPYGSVISTISFWIFPGLWVCTSVSVARNDIHSF